MIYILWPTIRPHMMVDVHKIWISRAVNKSKIITHVAVDTQDDADIVKKALNENDIIRLTPSDVKGVCYPCYQLTSKLEINDDDIVIFASDDFTPPVGWDNYLYAKLRNKVGCLMVRDGYQLPDSSNMLEPVITIPIMTFSCLKKLNKVIYNPVYTHLHADAELYINVRDLGLLIDHRMTDPMTFEHHHWAANKRAPDMHDQAYNNNWNVDLQTWESRKKMSVEDRIK